MIQKFSIKKISKYTILLLIVFLFSIFPYKKNYELDKVVSKNINTKYHDIFLIDKNNYVSKTNIQVKSLNQDLLIEELLEIMTIDGKYQDKIPNGFNAIIPSGVKLLNKSVDNNIAILNFSSDLFDVPIFLEEIELEAIIYTITSINGIDAVKIKIEGEDIKKLPKTGKLLPDELRREYGINKNYNISSIKNVNKVTIYYTNKTNNDNIYYVPVTKYINNNEEKIKIIIDELTSKISYESNLMSYLNYNAKLLDYSLNQNEIDLNFNEYLFDSNENKKVLEEVIYSILYSIQDNYKIDVVNFFVNNKKINY